MAGAKIGRNDPCPCGSGKKYKKCCAAVESGLDMTKTMDVVRFNKEIAYLGTIGRMRQKFCHDYAQHKQKWFREITKDRLQRLQTSMGKTSPCL